MSARNESTVTSYLVRVISALGTILNVTAVMMPRRPTDTCMAFHRNGCDALLICTSVPADSRVSARYT